MVLLFGILTLISTYAGGLFALRHKDNLHLILSFSAGAVLGVAFFDLLPEALELSSGTYGTSLVTLLVAVGFIVYMALSNWVVVGHHNDEECHNHNHKGVLGATSLIVHSFMDGAAIGLGLHVSTAVGIVIAVAVLAHDFSDGINTVSMVMRGSKEEHTAKRWLLMDSVAPTFGLFVAYFITVPEAELGLLLAVFCGFFLYMGASDLLPESHHKHGGYIPTAMTIMGMLVLYGVIQVAAAY